MALKGRAPTAGESAHMDRVQALGCIVCKLFYRMDTPCEIHHVDGKTKVGAHFRVIGLCASHHRGAPGVISRHGSGKKLFQRTYGTEAELMAKTWLMIDQ